MKNTPIQWAIDTVNPTSGCAGCELARPSMERNDLGPIDIICYAYWTHMNRLRHAFPEKYAQSFFEVRLIAGRIAEYARGRDLRGIEKKYHPWIPTEYPRVIFISDMADALSPDVPFEYLRDEVIKVAGATPEGARHVWLWLTKQAKRLVEFHDWLAAQGCVWPKNIWPGVSVTAANTLWRVDELLSRSFARTFVSYEPAWEWVDFFAGRTHLPSMIIAGGESGRNPRPFNLEVAHRLITACRKHGVAPFIKQLGAKPQREATGPQGAVKESVQLEDSHGGDWSEWPASLRVREFPSLN